MDSYFWHGSTLQGIDEQQLKRKLFMQPVFTPHLTLNDTLPQIAEHYFQERHASGRVSEEQYIKRLKQLRKSDEEIRAILIELDDDYDKFLLHGMLRRKATLVAILGFSVAIVLIAFFCVLYFQAIMSGKIILTFTSGIAVALVAGLKGLNELQMEKYRQERRQFKWSNWK